MKGGVSLRSSAQLMSAKKGCALISSAPVAVPSRLAGSLISSWVIRSWGGSRGDAQGCEHFHYKSAAVHRQDEGITTTWEPR